MEENRNTSTYKQALRERILETAMKAFAQKGVKAVKMDDIAQALGISKRTLYELYDNKEVLLYEGVEKFKRLREQQLRQTFEESATVMDVVLQIYRQKITELKSTSPQFYADINRYPRVMEFLEKDKKVSLSMFQEFLKRGVRENFFREDLDYDLVVQMFSALTQYVMSTQLYREYTLRHIFNNLVFVTLRGICTKKGIEILDRSLGNESE